MLRFIIKRLVMLVVTLLVASFLIYGSLYLAPGNPIASLTGGRAPSPEVVAQLNKQYHLNDPFLVATGTGWSRPCTETSGSRSRSTRTSRRSSDSGSG